MTVIAETKGSADARLTDRARPGGRKAQPLAGEVKAVPIRRFAWQRRAACRKAPTALFFPVGNSEQTRFQEEPAKLICAACPVRAHCLAFALEHQEPFGVWGGLNPQDRHALVAAGWDRSG